MTVQNVSSSWSSGARAASLPSLLISERVVAWLLARCRGSNGEVTFHVHCEGNELWLRDALSPLGRQSSVSLPLSEELRSFSVVSWVDALCNALRAKSARASQGSSEGELLVVGPVSRG